MSPTCPLPLTMLMFDAEFEPVPVESDPHAVATPTTPATNKETARDRPTSMELPLPRVRDLVPTR
jgi:hypothetical protein